jgi:hypothetical protein
VPTVELVDLTGAADAGTAWSQIWDGKILPWRTEYLLPRRRCACTTTTVARPPYGGVVNGISFGPVLNTAAVATVARMTAKAGVHRNAYGNCREPIAKFHRGRLSARLPASCLGEPVSLRDTFGQL